MIIPPIIEFKVDNPYGQQTAPSDIHNIVFHHFGFIPKDEFHIRQLSNSEIKRVYWNGKSTEHLVDYGNGMEKTFVPYHYIIDKDPVTKKFRYTKVLDPNTMCSAHDGLNDGSEYICNSISIAIAGDYRDSNYEPELKTIIRDMVIKLKQNYPISNVFGHREIDATNCPGLGWEEVKQELKDLVLPAPVLQKEPDKKYVDASVSRYVITRDDDPWYFRDTNCKWKGAEGFYPKTEQERKLALKCDFEVNCSKKWDRSHNESCLSGKGGKLTPAYSAACDVKHLGKRFIMNNREWKCEDVGGKIKDNLRGAVAIDLYLQKSQYKEFASYAGKQKIIWLD